MINYDKVNRKNAALASKISELSEKYRHLESEHQKVRQALDSTLHEVRRFSNEISIHAEALSKQLKQINADVYHQELCDTIMYTNGMISSRLGFTDIELNPASVRLQMSIRTGIYKKFEKARHVLTLKAKHRRVQIKMIGNSYIEIDALPSFELVPFVLLDNAIKYSPENQDVVVNFDEQANRQSLTVEVRSIGPMVAPEEAVEIFNRGKRGQNAIKLSAAGEGLGLFLAKFLCDYHDIRLSAHPSQHRDFDIGGVPYSQFVVRIGFDR